MKRLFSFMIICLVLCMPKAYAAKARLIVSDADSIYHEEHLRSHIGERDCHATGNYIKARVQPENSTGVGHLEQADMFELIEIRDGYACIRVIESHRTSPDSWNGMTGWVNSDYVDCDCTNTEYRLQASVADLRYYCTGNYVRIRNKPNGSKIIGHLEKADIFIVHETMNGWANIEVTHADKTSPDSRDGMTGWVNMQYIASNSVQVNSEDCSWKSAYRNYLLSNPIGDLINGGVFWLVYVDEDSTPELIIDTQVTAGGCHILTCHNGKVDSEIVGSNGCSYYIEKGNRLLNSAGQMGSYYDQVYAIENGKWQSVYYAENDELPSATYETDHSFVRSYYIGNRKVSRSEYRKTLETHFDSSKRTELTHGTDVSELMGVLSR